MMGIEKGTRVKIVEHEDYKGLYEGMIGITLEEGTYVNVAINGRLGSNVKECLSSALEQVEPGIDTLVVGDVVEDAEGDKSKVLASQGDILLLSEWNHFESARWWETKESLKQKDFEFVKYDVELDVSEEQLDETVELSKREIAEDLDVDPDNLVIKD